MWTGLSGAPNRLGKWRELTASPGAPLETKVSCAGLAAGLGRLSILSPGAFSWAIMWARGRAVLWFPNPSARPLFLPLNTQSIPAFPRAQGHAARGYSTRLIDAFSTCHRG